jgi:hypothetical protein
VTAELFHANRRTDRHDKRNSRNSQFTKAPKTGAAISGIDLSGETLMQYLYVSTSNWSFSCQFQGSTLHHIQLKLCYATALSGKRYELLLLSMHNVRFKCYFVYSSHFLR